MPIIDFKYDIGDKVKVSIEDKWYKGEILTLMCNQRDGKLYTVMIHNHPSITNEGFKEEQMIFDVSSNIGEFFNKIVTKATNIIMGTK